MPIYIYGKFLLPRKPGPHPAALVASPRTSGRPHGPIYLSCGSKYAGIGLPGCKRGLKERAMCWWVPKRNLGHGWPLASGCFNIACEGKVTTSIINAVLPKVTAPQGRIFGMPRRLMIRIWWEYVLSQCMPVAKPRAFSMMYMGHILDGQFTCVIRENIHCTTQSVHWNILHDYPSRPTGNWKPSNYRLTAIIAHMNLHSPVLWSGHLVNIAL